MTANPQLLAAYRRNLGSYKDRAVGFLTSAWDGLDNYDAPSIDTLATTVGPQLAGVKGATVATAVAFYATHLGIRPIGIAPSDVDVAAALRNPFTATWKALANGRDFTDAVAAGRSVAEATARNFVTSTARRSGDTFTARSGLTVRWERVAEPDACDWCQSKDGLIFLSAEDGDFGHDRCGCELVPAQ